MNHLDISNLTDQELIALKKQLELDEELGPDEEWVTEDAPDHGERDEEMKRFLARLAVNEQWSKSELDTILAIAFEELQSNVDWYKTRVRFLIGGGRERLSNERLVSCPRCGEKRVAGNGPTLAHCSSCGQTWFDEPGGCDPLADTDVLRNNLKHLARIVRSFVNGGGLTASDFRQLESLVRGEPT